MKNRESHPLVKLLYTDGTIQSLQKAGLSTKGSSIERTERWANFIRKNPIKGKSIQTEFINSLYKKANLVIGSMKKTLKGRKELQVLYGIKKNAYNKLLA
ncbi:MAG: hypothetical protein Q7K43_04855 [Candidatus Woesearchaeota archaeon]|nr:hypothetical protein [Candidatus Woesearchaeota archaeon]